MSISQELIRKTQRFAAGARGDLDEQLFMELINKADARSKTWKENQSECEGTSRAQAEQYK